jgi:predicted ATPase
MLERICIKGFKSIRKTDVRLGPLVVLMGPNTAGKSNFLEALVLLSRLVNQRTLADAFDQPIRGWPIEAFSLPESGIPGLLKQESAELSVEADIRPHQAVNGGNGDRLRYRVGVSIVPRTGALSVVDEFLARLGKADQKKGNPRIEVSDGKLVIRKNREAGQPNHEEIGLGHTIVSNLQYSGNDRYSELDRLRAETSAWRLCYLEPRDVMRQPRPPKEVAEIGTRGEHLASFLYRLRTEPEHRKYFDAVSRALCAAIPSIERLGVDLDEKRGAVEIVITQDGVPYSSRIISEGTLRVLALCALAANPWPSPLLAFEEPENGVHPRRIEVIARLLMAMSGGANRQVIVTTHSPQLVSALLRLQKGKELGEGQLCLLRCGQSAAGSRIDPLGSILPLFEDAEIRQAFASDEDSRILEALLLRGWLDG